MLEKKTLAKIFIPLVFISSYVLDYIPKLTYFEDELIALTSHILLLTELNFKAPFLVENINFTPTLTTGFNSSIGGAIGWLIFESFYFSRLFNLLWVLIEITVLNFYLYKKKIVNINFIYYSYLGLFCIPLWYNALYGIGEVLSSIIFFYSLILYEKNPKLSMFLISFSIFFGKFIIFLSFLVFIAVIIRKNNFKDLIYFSLPPLFWYSIIFYKSGALGLIEYFKSFTNFLFYHGVGKQNTSKNFFEEIIFDISISEISDWSYATLLRVAVVPMALSIFILFKYVVKEKSKTDLAISLILITNYLYFFVGSYQKYLRYSQVFVIICLYFILYLLSSEKNLSDGEKLFYVLLVSVYLSNQILIILFLITCFLMLRKNLSLFVIIFSFLILNIINLQYESAIEKNNLMLLTECKDNIATIYCVERYLPYEYIADK
jgi:hypothetical protein